MGDLANADALAAAHHEALKTELTRVEGELARCAEAIAEAGPLETILAAIKVREARRDAIRAELTSHGPHTRMPIPALATVRATLLEYLDDRTAMARAGIAEARRLLRAVLVGRLVFTPVPRPPDCRRARAPEGRRAPSTGLRGRRRSPMFSRG